MACAAVESGAAASRGGASSVCRRAVGGSEAGEAGRCRSGLVEDLRAVYFPPAPV